MSDLVKRLRVGTQFSPMWAELMGQAADAIERQQAVVDATRACDATWYTPGAWHQTEKDLHDALRALDGAP